MAKHPTHEPDYVIVQEDGDIFDRADELLRQLRAASDSNPFSAGGFILIFDAPDRDGVGMISNLSGPAIIEVLNAMLETARKTNN
jgi:hypothetical protein